MRAAPDSPLLANVLSFALAGVALVMAAAFWTHDLPLTAGAAALWSPLMLGGLGLARLGRPMAAKLYLIVAFDVSLFVGWGIIGRDAAVHLGGLIAAVLPVLLFDLRQRLPIALGVIGGAFVFNIPIFLPHWLEPLAVPAIRGDSGLIAILALINRLSSLAFLIFAVLHLKVMHDRSEARLRATAAQTAQLLKITCHDVASPLGVILTTLESMEADPKAKLDERVLPILRRTVGRMQDLLAVVRKLRSIDDDAGLALSPVPLAEAVRTAVAAQDEAFRAKGIELEVAPIDDRLSVLGDWRALTESVIPNLLSNARKFSRRGAKVRIGVEPQQRGGGIVLAVADEGLGMTQDLMSRVGDFFPPPSRPGTEGESGTGFGLTLVKTMAQRLGGRLELESSVGRGTTARLVLQEARGT